MDAILIIGAVLGTLLAFMIHEYCHGAMAYQLGDPTAKYEGRLTLNPIVHIDPIGSLVLVTSIIMSQGKWVIGWAKPVRFDANNLKSPFFDAGLIAMAGPMSNFILCFVLGILVQLVPLPPVAVRLLTLVIAANLGFGLFNCFPFPGLDGWKMLQVIMPRDLARKMRDFEMRAGIYAIFILLIGSYFLVDPIFKPTFAFLMGLLVGAS